MTLKLGFVEGVTPTKWIRIWKERFPHTPIEAFSTAQSVQLAPLVANLEAPDAADAAAASDSADADAVNAEDDAPVASGPQRADVALVRLPLDAPAGLELSVIPLYNEVAVVVVPKDHAIAKLDELTLAELAELAGESATGYAPGDPDLGIAMELVAAGVGVVIVPHSIARLHSRKDLTAKPVTDATETRIAIAWPVDHTTEDVEEFVGIVRGRTSASSRGIAPETKANGKVMSRADKAKAAARALREANGKQKKPGEGKKKVAGNGHRPNPNPGRPHSNKKKGKRR